jgi:hypothetical protein
MSGATFNDAIAWIAVNDDVGAGNPEFPLVSESMAADLFGTTADHVCFCVRRYRACCDAGEVPPRMNARPRGAA